MRTTVLFLACFVAIEGTTPIESFGSEMDTLRGSGEEKWKEETKFWAGITCRAGRRRSLALYKDSRNLEREYSRRVNEFFGSLVTNVQTDCGATIKTESRQVVLGEKNRLNHLDAGILSLVQDVQEPGKNGSEEFPETLEESCEENATTVDIFPQRDAEIVVVTVKDLSRSLLTNGNVFEEWHEGTERRFLILMIDEIVEISGSWLSSDKRIGRLGKVVREEELMDRLLQKLWLERRILNVYVAVPFSEDFEHKIWYHDPFHVDENSGVRGKTAMIQIEEIPCLDLVKNLRGYTLNVGMFEAYPTAIKSNQSEKLATFPNTATNHGFVGMDGLTMTTLAERMNFSVNIVPPTDKVEYGYVCDNGTLVGTIGDAAYGRIDVGFNAMYSKIYSAATTGTRAPIEFTGPIEFDRLCVIVPRAPTIPRWLRTFHYFHPAIWGCLGATQILVSIVWYCLRNCGGHASTGDNGYNAFVLETFLLFLGSPLSSERLRNITEPEKILIAALLILGVTVVGTLTGTLYHSFTNEMHYREIDTLTDLEALGIGIATASPSLGDVFGLDSDEETDSRVRNLRARLRVVDYDGIPTIEKTAYRRNIASLSRQQTFLVVKHRYVDDDTGASLLHRVQECPRSYYLSYPLRRGSPYIERINQLVVRLKESGLPQMWNLITVDRLIVAERAQKAQNHPRVRRTANDLASFDLHEMQTCFFLLSIGHAFAFCVLLGELALHRGRRYLVSERTFQVESMQ